MFKKKESTRLGEILVSKGLITPEQLAIATHEQTKRNRLFNVTDAKAPKGVMIGEILVEFGFIDQLELKRGLNWQQRLRHVSIAMALCAPFMVFAPTGASAQTVSSSSKSSSASTNFNPVIIQAENYATMGGVWNESTTDVGGGKDTGNIDTADWMSYTNSPVDIPATGTYKITYRVASLNKAGILALKEASTEAILDTVPLPITGGWQTWVDVTRTVTLAQGSHSFKLVAIAGGFNLNWFKIELVSASTVSSSAASSTAPSATSSTASSISSVPSSTASSASSKTSSAASSISSNINTATSSTSSNTSTAASSTSSSTASVASVPPWIIEAENYTSMSGVWNEPTADVGGGKDTGNIDTGDWMSYANTKVNIPTTGLYKITMRVASPNSTGRLALKESGTEATLDTISIPLTGGWQTWTDVTRTVSLTQGAHSFKLLAEVGGFNINWFKIEPIASQTALTIQAENYSAMKGVWNESTTDVGGGQDTGNIDALDWMVYYNVDVSIPTTGNYKITYRVASPNGGGSFTLSEAGTTKIYDTIPVAKTGGWQQWANVERVIQLPAGKHNFGINAIIGGFNLNWFKIEPVTSTASSSSQASSAASSISTSTPASSSSSSSSSPSTVTSSSSSSPTTTNVAVTVKGPVGLSWDAPSQRENGNLLDITEVGGYEIRYKLASAASYTYITINDAWTSQYNFTWLEGDYIFQIAAFDKNGIYSNFVDIRPK
ncbi:hypothetical protein GCM10011613_27720 [Cellvibrio zantedeschiae]|uniref:CBM6 domain-containing protein n=1 Tax=Cellvibrio zantedeschiae TaxID=1237077 RepID=A0ABQ3B998_9GAMM|nr:carbohydrate-binding protein [Cellvibrio zantedeschiae]GGY81120.1 hypothetical protein GCM10011613_27720 [Cellvibrio zantedeschiae]